MKRLLGIICIILIVAMTGCSNGNDENATASIVDEKFMLYSLPWGETWDNVKDYPQLASGTVVRDDGNLLGVEVENTEFLGVKGKTVLTFYVSEQAFPSSGLASAYFFYDAQDEEKIIAEGEKIYGERKDHFLDKNGIANPIQPSGWYSAQTVEGSFTAAEKEKYLEYAKDVEPTRIDTLLRRPLVVIRIVEEEHMIEFSGVSAAVVKNIKQVTE